MKQQPVIQSVTKVEVQGKPTKVHRSLKPFHLP